MSSVLKTIGRIHWPYTHKLTTGEEYVKIARYAFPGFILLSRTRGELTNLGIKGPWKHAAICVGNGLIVEAISEGVTQKRLDEFYYKKDFVALYKPLFADEGACRRAALWAVKQVGAPYDYGFKTTKTDSRYYCSELVYYAYYYALGVDSPLELWRRGRFDTILPTDIAKAETKFERFV